jgi:ribosomal protein S18 acetylase RimI-like enzyme
VSDVVLRQGEPADIEPVIAVWRAATTARGGGRPLPPEHETRVRAYLQQPDAFLLVADAAGTPVGLALGMQGRADDGAGPPVPGLCHIGMVFVAPDHWGAGIGRRIVDAVLAEARVRGYARVQLWTHADNLRAQRLYEGRGFRRSGREQNDDLGEMIVHYERAL